MAQVGSVLTYYIQERAQEFPFTKFTYKRLSQKKRDEYFNWGCANCCCQMGAIVAFVALIVMLGLSVSASSDYAKYLYYYSTTCTISNITYTSVDSQCTSSTSQYFIYVYVNYTKNGAETTDILKLTEISTTAYTYNTTCNSNDTAKMIAVNTFINDINGTGSTSCYYNSDSSSTEVVQTMTRDYPAYLGQNVGIPFSVVMVGLLTLLCRLICCGRMSKEKQQKANTVAQNLWKYNVNSLNEVKSFKEKTKIVADCSRYVFKKPPKKNQVAPKGKEKPTKPAAAAKANKPTEKKTSNEKDKEKNKDGIPDYVFEEQVGFLTEQWNKLFYWLGSHVQWPAAVDEENIEIFVIDERRVNLNKAYTFDLEKNNKKKEPDTKGKKKALDIELI